jgi:hypothetical protein
MNALMEKANVKLKAEERDERRRKAEVSFLELNVFILIIVKF